MSVDAQYWVIASAELVFPLRAVAGWFCWFRRFLSPRACWTFRRDYSRRLRISDDFRACARNILSLLFWFLLDTIRRRRFSLLPEISGEDSDKIAENRLRKPTESSTEMENLTENDAEFYSVDNIRRNVSPKSTEIDAESFSAVQFRPKSVEIARKRWFLHLRHQA